MARNQEVLADGTRVRVVVVICRLSIGVRRIAFDILVAVMLTAVMIPVDLLSDLTAVMPDVQPARHVPDQ